MERMRLFLLALLLLCCCCLEVARSEQVRKGIEKGTGKGKKTMTAISENRTMLVDVVIIGAQKGGTTALSYSLATHPSLAWAKKEIQFFDKDHNFKKGVRWYHDQFPAACPAVGRGNTNASTVCLYGEKTPSYLPSSLAMERIHKYNPDMKLLVVLRDPVTRLFSDYNMHKQTHVFNPKPWSALPYNAGSFDKFIFDEEMHAANPHNLDFHKDLGMYAKQLRFVFSLFKRSQVYIQISEEAHDMAELMSFLGLDLSITPPPTEKREHVRNYNETMSRQANCTLAKVYEKSNEELFELLGRRIPKWTTVKQACTDV